MKYDVLVVGAGLYGAVCARELTDAGQKVLVVEKRPQVGGNLYTEEVEGIAVHRYGAHIFHTNDAAVWRYVNRFAEFNRFTNAPLARYHDRLFSLPFNMYTFHQLWGVITPAEAEARLAQQRAEVQGEPRNLEEQAIALVGRDLYETLVKGYTEKQWGRDCRELPASVIRRLPLRLTYDNNYFTALYQGIPTQGYTALIRRLLEGAEVQTGVDYLADREYLRRQAPKVIYTGPIDAWFDFREGPLAYRTLRFETETLNLSNYQGNAVVNYTDRETPWTRIIEHKWFTFGRDTQGRELPKTVITREYSREWVPGDEPFYPVGDSVNTALYEKYRALAAQEPGVLFGGRLGEYRYYDMDQVIAAALAALSSGF